MRIDFQRSGGVTGMTLSVTVDTESLPDAEAGELQELVDRSGFFSMPEPAEAPAAAADQFSYVLTIESGERRRTLEITDAAAPAELVPLLDWLVRRARRRAGG